MEVWSAETPSDIRYLTFRVVGNTQKSARPR
jgi:hypothetical protein